MSGLIKDIRYYYQGIYNRYGEIVKCELLSRFPPEMNIGSIECFFENMSPDDSFDITINQLALSKYFHDAFGLVCSINVDNYILIEDRLKRGLIEECRKYSHPIILEFTELRPMPPPGEINPVFLELKRSGVVLALDDFGTGFNGISVFADYDFDIVKLDRKLISGIQDRPQKLHILSHILNLLVAMDKQHVVEGVETEAQLSYLVDIGFDTFQGFWFHKPSPVEALQ